MNSDMKLDAFARKFMTQDALDSFANSIDFRDRGHVKYPSGLLLLIAFMGVTLGESSWNDIAEMAEDKLDVLQRYYPNIDRAPSHDTLRRFFMLVDNAKLEECYRKWAKSLCDKLPVEELCDLRGELQQRFHPAPIVGQHIAIDGKTIRKAMDKKQLLEECPECTTGQLKHARLHMVTAFNTELGLALGQEKVPAKNNEITVIPDLIRALNINKGDVITLDAMGTQTAIVDAIVEKEADYVLPVKRNQRKLMQTIESVMKVEIARMPKHRTASTYEREDSHGRIVRRTCYMSVEPLLLANLHKRWKGIRSFGVIIQETTNKKTGEEKEEKHYFISSLGKAPKQILKYKRRHWGIENNLHWILDVHFNEDSDRKKMNAAMNCSLINKMVIAQIRAMDSKDNFKSRRKRLARNDQKLIDFIDNFILTLADLNPKPLIINV